MAQAALVSDLVDAGRDLVAAADAAGVPIRAALWLYDSHEDRWTLVIEAPPSPRLDKHDYALQLHQAVGSIPDPQRREAARDLLFGAVTLATKPHPVAQLLRPSLGQAASVLRARLSHTSVGQYIVEGAVLYRLERSQAV
ncbi:MAG: hypothetical protein HY904_19005 [Deltaproteobacteria bacterium]|nr:hypothetical protein [Deltaproteobacteria bacterium]